MSKGCAVFIKVNGQAYKTFVINQNQKRQLQIVDRSNQIKPQSPTLWYKKYNNSHVSAKKKFKKAY